MMDNKIYDHILDKIRAFTGEATIMELCGSHTAAISKCGLRAALPANIRLISGPGCPVCVTPASYISLACALAEDNIVTTFGDLLRVPGVDSETLQNKENVKIVYSPIDAVEIAKSTDREVIFLAIGFETTMPAIALAIEKAEQEKVNNFTVLTSLKTMPNALEWIIKNTKIDMFLLPGHVCTISGTGDYAEICKKTNAKGVVAGFTPFEVGLAILAMLNIKAGNLQNCYPIVKENGNEAAKKSINKFFMPTDAYWRGIGEIKNSGMILREEYNHFSAEKRFELNTNINENNNNCMCGQVLIGEIKPDNCPDFSIRCTPTNPLGPCMVSSEGACRIYYDDR